MKYAILGLQFGISRVLDRVPLKPHVEISDEQAEKVLEFKSQNRLAFLIDGEITNFREQRSLGNSMVWDKDENKWIISPIESEPELTN